MGSDEWTRDLWTPSNWCAHVGAGATREDRAARLAECPVVWQTLVRAHVECLFKVAAEARRRQALLQQAPKIQKPEQR